MQSVLNYIGIPKHPQYYHYGFTKDNGTKLPTTPTTAASTTAQSSHAKGQRRTSPLQPIINNATDTKQINPRNLKALMHNISKQQRIRCDLPAAQNHPNMTSAQLTIANALWYSNTEITGDTAKNAITNTWTLNRNYGYCWAIESTEPNQFKTRLPAG